jgi:hypothetical protein
MKTNETTNIGKPNLNFIQLLAKMGKEWQMEFYQNIVRQRNIGEGSFAPVKMSTLRSRAYQKGLSLRWAGKDKRQGVSKSKGRSNINKFMNVSNKRLWFTTKFAKDMTRFVAEKLNLTVLGNPATYPDSKVSYSDIIAYNNRNSPRTNQKVDADKRPIIFPTNPEELKDTKTFAKLRSQLSVEAKKQLKEQLYISKKITVKL